jgi:K+-sensing histidine kinase KdpD
MKTTKSAEALGTKLLRLLTGNEQPSRYPLQQCFEKDFRNRFGNIFANTGKAIAIMATTTLFCWLGKDVLKPEACCLVFLGVTVLFGALMPPPAPFLLAALGLVSWNYFFTPPAYELSIRTSDELILHILFVLIAAVMNSLTANLRQRERASRLNEQTSTLLRNCQEALSQGDVDACLRLINAATGAQTAIRPKAQVVEGWLIVCTPLSSHDTPATFLCLEFKTPAIITAQGKEILQSLAHLISAYFERRRFIAEAEKAHTANVSEKIGRALLDNVTHEIKTPAAFMLASLHRIRSRDDGRHENEIRGIAEGAHRLVRLTEELTLMSSVRTQMLQPRVEHCNASELAREIIQEDVRPTHAAILDLITRSPEACVRTDPHLAGIILGNLISNACRHSPADCRVKLTVERRNDEVVFSVSDRGNGVSIADLPHVFDRFYRGANPGSLGLGLSISREIAGIIGAKLTVSETPGGGATFQMALPLTEPYLEHEDALS